MTIPHQGIGRGRLVPSSNKGSKFRYTIVRQFSRGDERIREDIPIPDSLGKETFQVLSVVFTVQRLVFVFNLKNSFVNILNKYRRTMKINNGA